MPDGREESLPTRVEQDIYDHRFPATDLRQRMELWRVIAGYLQRYVPTTSVLIELGAGNGEFVSNIVAAERWATDIRPRPPQLHSDIRYVSCDGLALLDAVPAGYFDRVFMSNYLEHLPSSDEAAQARGTGHHPAA
jgi:hypothetical protein